MKDYKKILEGVVNIVNTTEKSDIGFVNICTYLDENCPELKESEGEKIRKVLIGWINLEPSTSFNDTFGGFSKEQILAWFEKQGNTNIFDVPKISIKNAVEVTSRMQYIDDDIKPIAEFIMDYANWDLHKDEWNQPTLTVPLFRVLDALIQKGKPYCVCNQNIEKQGEHNPADKAEPKFKVSDYVVDNCGYIWRIEGIINKFYILEGIDGGESRPTIEWVNKTFHLWDITKDAKDGDVLFMDNLASNCIFIYKSSNNGIINKYASYSKFGFECEHYLVLNDGYVIPATKEQCDTLERVMTNDGYRWNKEELKLEKI